jgi:hypothetical protein
MLNRKNKLKMKMEPSRINNYNKFLITLDKSEPYTNVEGPTIIGKTEQVENKINTIIDKLVNEYKNKGHDSSNFTGQTTKDISSVDMDIDDPNEYKELVNGKKERRKDIIVSKLVKPCTKRKDPYIDKVI